jgi:Tfp pilus assembly protein PilV
MQIGCECPFARRAGFTFAEVLVAMLFLAILVPAVVEGLSLGNRAAVLAERNTVAVQLGERQLNELLVNDTWVSSDVRGTFGEAWSQYRWELERGTWREDDMTQLTLRVLFNVQGVERAVTLSTLVDDSEL